MTSHSGDDTYDVTVVGAGMMGSAAAKHLLSLNPRLKVALIGPQITEVSEENTIHGAHYDEGRITRELGSDHVWSTLANRSIQRYREIESLSGINFYNEVGFLTLGKKDGPYNASVKDVIRQNNISHESMEGRVLGMSFPCLKVTEDTEGIFTSKKSGHISPRLLVKAQRQIAMMLGCNVIDDITKRIEEKNGYISITTDKGRIFNTKKVLLATGAFTHCKDLLPQNNKVLIDACATTVLLSEIDEKDLPHFYNMPSLYVEKECPTLQKECDDIGFYILPPILYPNGKWYLKIGQSSDDHIILDSPKEMDDWYKQRIVDKKIRPLLYKAREKIFQGIKPVAEHFDQCILGMTASLRPYIDLVTPSIGVALGGCGWAAKSSDEIGLVAARMISKGSWDYDLPKEYFRCQFKVPKNQSKL